MPRKHIKVEEKAPHKHKRIWFRKSKITIVHRKVLSLVMDMTYPETILDIGCGSGGLMHKASLLWPTAQILGVDPALEKIKAAQALNATALLYIGTAEKLPMQDASVDVVLSTLALHHWHDPARSFMEIKRVLRPDGYFFLFDLILPDWYSKLFQRSQLQSLFMQAGLVIKLQYLLLPPFGLITVGAYGNQSTR